MPFGQSFQLGGGTRCAKSRRAGLGCSHLRPGVRLAPCRALDKQDEKDTGSIDDFGRRQALHKELIVLVKGVHAAMDEKASGEEEA